MLSVPQDYNVATALLTAGIIDFRKTATYKANRGPYCMMGACFDCLINIDGVDNQQSCMIQVRQGMIIKRQMINDSERDE